MIDLVEKHKDQIGEKPLPEILRNTINNDELSYYSDLWEETLKVLAKPVPGLMDCLDSSKFNERAFAIRTQTLILELAEHKKEIKRLKTPFGGHDLYN